MNYSSEIKFCVKYLLEHGVNALNFNDVVQDLTSSDEKFNIVKRPKEQKVDFFVRLAQGLRELWPSGEKMINGKGYAWRDSVPNLSRRLRTLWNERFPDFKETDESVEQCLTVARRYLSRYENDTKYMQTLPYFIWKQKELVENNGRITYVRGSKFADMLEGKADEDAIMNEWDFLINQTSIGEGELV